MGRVYRASTFSEPLTVDHNPAVRRVQPLYAICDARPKAALGPPVGLGRNGPQPPLVEGVATACNYWQGNELRLDIWR